MFNMIFLSLWIISYKVLAMLTQFYAGYIFTTMVISCVAYRCTNRVGKGCDISFYRHVKHLVAPFWVYLDMEIFRGSQSTAIQIYFMHNLTLQQH